MSLDSQQNRLPRLHAYAIFFLLSAAIVIFSHLPLIDLPFYWDELGYYVPAALDFFHSGSLIPTSVFATAHPPGLSIYLATFWTVFGYSIEVTRVAILILASLVVFLTFVLAIQLSSRVPGLPAFVAAGWLLVNPVFFMQGFSVTPETAATVCFLACLLAYIHGRYVQLAIYCLLFVAFREVGIVVVLGFAYLLYKRQSIRHALLVASPAAGLLGVWYLLLWWKTGHFFGHPEFSQFNVFYNFHWLRLPLAIARRLLFIFFEHFHWVGWILVLLSWKRLVTTLDWKFYDAGALSILYALSCTLFGGAVLERYLLPVLPLLYVIFAISWSTLTELRLRRALLVATLTATLTGLFLEPFYPAPLENHLGIVRSVNLQKQVAVFLDANFSDRIIVTAWPLSDALKRPEFGYTTKALHVRKLADFSSKTLQSLDPNAVDVFVLYRREATGSLDMASWRPLKKLRYLAYGYQPDLSPEEIEAILGVEPVMKFSLGKHWAIVYRGRDALQFFTEPSVQAIRGYQPKIGSLAVAICQPRSLEPNGHKACLAPGVPLQQAEQTRWLGVDSPCDPAWPQQQVISP